MCRLRGLWQGAVTSDLIYQPLAMSHEPLSYGIILPAMLLDPAVPKIPISVSCGLVALLAYHDKQQSKTWMPTLIMTPRAYMTDKTVIAI